MNKTITGAKTLEDTELWQALKEKDQQGMSALVGALPDLCQEAASRMKMVPVDFPLYTLHDETHLLRVVEIMGLILGETIGELNALELALLILSAYMHDLGMVLDGGERRNLEQDPKFLNYRGEWRVQHGNYAEIAAQKTDTNLSGARVEELGKKIGELDRAMLTDYLRETHASRSREYVVATFSTDRRMEFSGVNIAGLVGRLCESHGKPVRSLNESNGFRFDEEIGTLKVNLPYLAVLLRLADILDFDSDRTPDVLFRTIHFTNNVSLEEWEKHRGIKGWTISASLIRYTAEYEHPAYQAACLKFMDWIDEELSSCHALCRNFPTYVEGHRLNLPGKVERDRIVPKDDAYEYHELEISLSRDEIIKLLMADKLYNKPHFCVRELLQNSLDALRYRKTLYAAEGLPWNDGKVEFVHSVDADGYEVLKCTDNGVGMELDVIQRFLTRAGRSFYRSPEYERQRIYFREKGVDFDPCSQFGIGFMSCFMLGDRIQIETRRDNGPQNTKGEPWVVEITGLGSIVVIRKGKDDQPIGTTVKITSRKKPRFLDVWTDQVKLTSVLMGYAIGTEFPIYGTCTIDELRENVEIPVTISEPKTFLDSEGEDGVLKITQDFNEIDSRLNGYMSQSFIVDASGAPRSETEEAEWLRIEEGSRSEWKLFINGKVFEMLRHNFSQIAIDGVLLSGKPGRPDFEDEKIQILGSRSTGLYGPSYILDVRGELKPEITPARTPPDHIGSLKRYPSWDRLQALMDEASGKIWEKVAELTAVHSQCEEFWKLTYIYGATILGMRPHAFWANVSMPVLVDQRVEWRRLDQLGELTVTKPGENWHFEDCSGNVVTFSSIFIDWEQCGETQHSTSDRLRNILGLMCESYVEDGVLRMKPKLPAADDPAMVHRVLQMGLHRIHLHHYLGGSENALAIQGPVSSANINHPISQLCRNFQYRKKLTRLEEFADNFLTCIDGLLDHDQPSDIWERPSRWMKVVGHRYYDIDWESEDPNYKPPYRLWSVKRGWFEISENDFAQWRDAPIREEERSL